MYLELPVRTDIPSYAFQQELEGTLFELEFNFNARGNYWMMDINDGQKNQILSGIKVVEGFPLTKFIRVNGSPLGDFIAYDTTGKHQNPDMTNFGSNVVLYYRESTTVDLDE